MTDITTTWDAGAAVGDWALAGPLLAAGDDLTTAVLISLFTDGRASDPELVDVGARDPRGWWGDQGSTTRIGSRLWLRFRAKASAATLRLVRGDIVDALQWLIDDGVVASIDVATEWTRPGELGARVVLHRDGAAPLALNFRWVWNGVI
ncbi:phage GP46 family protein [Phenylobacterium sp.]|uniref:phage GP46 family protein n=1 Tax=Phenylobacterium sp. TaxID=1871053 RepID=UPI0035B43DAF